MLDDMLTENEAASITGVPRRQIDRMIEAGWLDGFMTERGADRRIPRSILVGLRLAHATAGVLTDETRRAVVAAHVRQPMMPSIRTGDAVSVDTTLAMETVRLGLDALVQAQALVRSDPEIMGGTPVFHGTRIPVYQIAAMRQNGDSIASLVEAFPALDRRMVELAAVYAEAYPMETLWSDRPATVDVRLKRRQMIPLDDHS